VFDCVDIEATPHYFVMEIFPPLIFAFSVIIIRKFSTSGFVLFGFLECIELGRLALITEPCVLRRV
jgi:hypothetical protein